VTLLRSRLAALSAIVGGGLLLFDQTEVRYPSGSAATDIVVIEPERRAVFASEVTARQSDLASGGGYITIEGWNHRYPDYGRRVVGEMVYKAYFNNPGLYRVWVRARWHDSCGNSLTLLVRPDRSAPIPLADPRHLIGNDNHFQGWHWIRGPALNLEKGAYEVLLGTRESNVDIDVVILSSASAYRPDEINITPGPHR
jgi:hypothetical protein